MRQDRHAAAGQETQASAENLGPQPATVSTWRKRFAEAGIVGPQDKPRYGRLLAEALDDVSPDYIWQALHNLDISFQRRHGWRLSGDPEFAAKATGKQMFAPE